VVRVPCTMAFQGHYCKHLRTQDHQSFNAEPAGDGIPANAKTILCAVACRLGVKRKPLRFRTLRPTNMFTVVALEGHRTSDSHHSRNRAWHQTAFRKKHGNLVTHHLPIRGCPESVGANSVWNTPLIQDGHGLSICSVGWTSVLLSQLEDAAPACGNSFTAVLFA
jgi:hypothetical protein